MAQVQLFKKNGTYKDRDGKEKHFTNFYVKCNDTLIPVEVCYFQGEDGRDNQYSSRKAVLSAFSDILPEKQSMSKTPSSATSSSPASEKTEKKVAELKMADDDTDLPF